MHPRDLAAAGDMQLDAPLGCLTARRSSVGSGCGRIGALVGASTRLALYEPVAFAAHFQDVDVTGEPVAQRAGETLKLHHAQTQRVPYDRHRTERHCQRRDDRREQNAECRI